MDPRIVNTNIFIRVDEYAQIIIVALFLIASEQKMMSYGHDLQLEEQAKREFDYFI